VPRSTGTGATVSRACGRQRNEAGPITRRFRSAVWGEQKKKQFRGSLRVRGSASGQAQKPIQSEFGWETGGRPQRPKTPIQNAFGWGMGLDGDGWACLGAVTISHITQRYHGSPHRTNKCSQWSGVHVCLRKLACSISQQSTIPGTCVQYPGLQGGGALGDASTPGTPAGSIAASAHGGTYSHIAVAGGA